MTNPRPRRPEPSSDSAYDTYLMPRSKTPRKDELLLYLAAIGWRFDAVHMCWHPPENLQSTAFGRLEYASDLSWARVQAPSVGNQRGPALLEMTWFDTDLFVGWDVKR